MSTIKANDIQNASGGIPTVKGQRLIPTAWVNFNGEGTVAIRDSENVSSITDTATGQYSINFTTALSNSDYSSALASNAAVTNQGGFNRIITRATTYLSIRHYENGSTVDTNALSAIILGGQA